MMEQKELPPVTIVSRLPKKAIGGKLIFNIKDGYFYKGVDTEKEVQDGNNLEETSVRD